MLVHKITTGFVTQVFDTETGLFVSQKFTAGDECDYETPDGETVEPTALNGPDGKECYLPYDMVQPPEELGDLLVPGARVWNTDQTEVGISKGKCGEYRGEAGDSDRIRVVWPDGSYTKPTTAGILPKKGRWTIC